MAEAFIAQRARLVNLLWGRGYFPAYASGAQALELLDRPTFDSALADFSTLNNRDATEEAVEFRFCLQPDRSPLRRQLCRWKHSPVTWHTEGGLEGVSPSDFKTTASDAFHVWMAVCGWRVVYTQNPKSANIWLHAANLGGPGDVLADQQLPCSAGPSARLEGRYDGENWVLPGQAGNGPSLRTTLIHELGHAAGIDHGPQGSIMAPTLSKFSELQAWDIGEALKRYPAHFAPPAPPPAPGQARIRLSAEWDAVTGKLLSGAMTGGRVTILG